MVIIQMKKNKRDRQQLLTETIENNPFITDEELAEKFSVSIQTIRLDRLEMSIPELRERIKHVAKKSLAEEVKALSIDEVIGEIIDIELDNRAISILEIKQEHVFKRNGIARGHHLFAQANSLAVAVIDDSLALTTKATVSFIRQVKINDKVIAKVKVIEKSHEQTWVNVKSYVEQELVFSGEFILYRQTKE